MNRFAFTILAFFVCVQLIHAQDPSNISGRKAPTFRTEDIDGNLIELKAAIGKGPVLLSFWATWCKPCMEEMNEMQKIYDEFKDKGLQLFAISKDNEKSVSKVKPLVKSKKFTFPVLLDPSSEVSHKFFVENVPHTILIDQKGIIVLSHSGYKKGDEAALKKKISDLLK